MPTDLSNADTLKEHALRMHKLRGSAGTLAASAVQDAASQAEAACRSGDVALTEAMTRKCRGLLDALSRALPAAWLEGTMPPSPLTANPAARLDAQALAGLRRSLRDQSLDALDQFHSLSEQLHQRLGSTAFWRLRDDMESLRFAEALVVVDALVEAPTPVLKS